MLRRLRRCPSRFALKRPRATRLKAALRECINAPIQPTKGNAQSQLTATGQATRGALTSADQAKLNTARRNEHNLFPPRESIGDARQRMRAGFSPADFAEGTSTMRGSMKPLGDVPHASWVVHQHRKGTRLDAAAVPGFKKRLLGESTHDYLARHGVQQSLTAAQQSAADNSGWRMAMVPRPGSEPRAPRRAVSVGKIGPKAVTRCGFRKTSCRLEPHLGRAQQLSAAQIEAARMTNG